MQKWGYFTNNINDIDNYNKFIDSVNEMMTNEYDEISPEEANIGRQSIFITTNYMLGLISVVNKEYSSYITRFALPEDLEPVMLYEEIINPDLTGSISFRLEFIPRLSEVSDINRRSVRDVWLNDSNIKDIIHQDTRRAANKREKLFNEMDLVSNTTDPVAARFAANMLGEFYRSQYDEYIKSLEADGWVKEAI